MNTATLLDKLGERIAFEGCAVRLYEALIASYDRVRGARGELLPAAGELMEELGTHSVAFSRDESPVQTLQRIRGEEQDHLQMLAESVRQLGGDPDAPTAGGQLVATASSGLLQVLADPHTTLAQAFNTVLSAELIDNAGWELLMQLAEDAGETELASCCLAALDQEKEHLAIVKGWLSELVAGAGNAAE